MTEHRNDEDRKLQICRAAARCLLRNGYAATRLIDIAQEAGMSKGGIYFHYRSKEALVCDLLMRQARAFEAFARRREASGRAPDDVLADLVRGYLRGTFVDPGAAVLGEVLASLAPVSPVVRRELARFEAALRAACARVLLRGMECGAFRKDDVGEMASMVVALLLGASVQAAMRGRGRHPRADEPVVEAVLHMLRRSGKAARRPLAAEGREAAALGLSG